MHWGRMSRATISRALLPRLCARLCWSMQLGPLVWSIMHAAGAGGEIGVCALLCMDCWSMRMRPFAMEPRARSVRFCQRD